MNRITTQKNYRKGFTLAEVLITLGIIGVVAALVIPALNNQIQEQEFKTAYKKAFSVGSQAIQRARAENLFTDASYDSDNNVYTNNFLVFMGEFKTSKQCLSNNNVDCWGNVGEKAYNTYPNANSFAFIDNSGVVWSMSSLTWDSIHIDTNGSKLPNQYGKDRFVFYTQESNTASSAAGHAAVRPITRLRPYEDNAYAICATGMKCDTEHNYYGTSWLYN